jgi:heme-degrading monooxygenase HmoA
VTSHQANSWRYVIIWEFVAKAGEEARFEAAYGPNGAWAGCFRQGAGYLGTELNRDARIQRRYVTMDFWASKEAYEEFKAQHAAEYEAIDHKCADLTEQERELGKFERVEN